MTEQGLIYLCGGRIHALSLGYIIEIMRILPIDTARAQPPFFTGMCTIRGEAVPAVDLSPLCCPNVAKPTRLVTIRAGGKRFALLADEVLGVRTMPETSRPVLDAIGGDLKKALAGLDTDLRQVIQAIRIVSTAPTEQEDA